MADKDELGNWINSRGNPVHPSMVERIDKKRDKAAEQIYKIAVNLQKRMRKAKGKMIKIFEDFEDFSFRLNGVKAGGEKDGLTISNFSITRKVKRSRSPYVVFDERLQQAVQLINECMDSWTSDVQTPAKTIIQQVMKPDANGRLSFKGLKSLKHLKIKDEKWKKAMELVSAAERDAASKLYYGVYERTDPEKKEEMISLDFASLDPIFPVKKSKKEKSK